VRTSMSHERSKIRPRWLAFCVQPACSFSCLCFSIEKKMKDDLNRFGAWGNFLSLTAGEFGENGWSCLIWFIGVESGVLPYCASESRSL
jgi:hypothetical protein